MNHRNPWPSSPGLALGTDADDRLLLADLLLKADDVGTAAQRGVDWLADQLDITHSICMLVDPDRNRLVTVAAHGFTVVLGQEFSIDLYEAGHPLVQALGGTQPVTFSPSRAQPQVPLRSRTVQALPFHTDGEGAASGLLVVGGSPGPAHPTLQWAAERIGEALARLQRTARHHTAERRSERERTLLYSIINAVTDPILLTDPEGKLIIANAHAEKLFASRDEESEGRRRAVTLNNMLFSAALSSQAIEQTQTSRFEVLLVDPIEGSDLLFELLSSPVKDAGGVTGVVSILRNVTDLGRATEEINESYRKLRQAEAEVRAERHRLDLIIDSVADPILVTDASGDIVLMNDPAEKLFNAQEPTEEVLRGVRANDAHFSSFVSNLLFSGTDRPWRGEIGLVEPAANTPIPVEAVAGKILSETGELTAVVTILHDRTQEMEKARLYDQLKHASDELEAKVQAATAELATQNELLRRQHIQLEQASALKSQFLANMSHEFRTPLNAILGYTSMLLQGVSGELAPAQRKNLMRIESNSRHLTALINDILDITRIEAGRMPLHLSDFRLPELVREVTAELEPIITRSRLAVTTEISPKVPILHSDRHKVKQIVLNLFSNALKFTHAGSVRIVANYEVPDRIVSIAVADTGIGIADTDLEAVFEDFRQVDNSPSRAYGGTGLGLSICRRLAAMLDGQITVTSRLGEGSTFTLHLPSRQRRKYPR